MDGLVIKGESVLAVGQGLLASLREELLLRVSKEIQRNDAKGLTYISLLVDGHQTVELSALSLVEVVGVVNEASVELNPAQIHLYQCYL
jgi:hypothetical protein